MKKQKNIVSIISMSLIVVLLIGINVASGIFGQWLTEFFGGRGTTEVTEVTLSDADNLVREIEGEGIVLLKNDDNALPLTKPTINVFGWASTDAGFKTSGSGSGDASAHSEGSVEPIKFLDGLKKAGFWVNDELTKIYTKYKATDDRGGSLDIPSDTFFKFYEPDKSVYTTSVMKQALDYSDTALVVLSRSGGEGQDLPKYQTYAGGNDRATNEIIYDKSRTYLEISKREEDLLNLVKNAGFKKVIVVINAMNAMELGFLDDSKIDAALLVGGPGQTGSLSIGHVLQGRVNPSGRTVDTYAYDLSTSPSFEDSADWGVHQYNGYKADEYTPNHSTPGSSYIDYVEGIYVGYKWYETADSENFWNSAYAKNKWNISNGYDDVVQYPFGYGLSYSEFSYNVKSWSERNGEISVTVDVKNITKGYDERFKQYYAGKDVLELYYSPVYKKGEIEKASVNLCAFVKTPLIKVGETETVTLSFKIEDMKSYDCYDLNNNGHFGYELEKGNYEISLRKDAHHLINSSNNTYTYKIDKDIYYDEGVSKDYKIENRFTGDNAYAGISIDGSSTNENITYLTRSNFANTFPNYVGDDKASRNKDQLLVNAGNHWYEKVKEDKKPITGSTNTSFLLTENGKYNDELVSNLGSDYDDPRWDDLIDQIKESELLGLVEDAGFQTKEINSIGKLRCIDVDGPTGLNANNIGGLDTLGGLGTQTAYPVEVVVASTWNSELALRFGQMVGVEAAEANISGWYAPGANIHRNPFDGRNFEYYSEDAYLSGVICANQVKGSLSKGLYSYVKHFAVNETEEQRSGLYTWLSEQTLREIYLRPFEMAIKDGHANALMTSFNRIGAIWCGGNKALLEDVVRGEWGFRGTMLTDWSTGGDYMNLDQGLASGSDAWLNGAHQGPWGHDDKNSNEGIRDMKRAAKNIVYTYCNTYYLAKTLGDGMALKEQQYVFPVWIFIPITLNIVGLGGVGFMLYKTIKRNKKEQKEEGVLGA